jgi:hypothetical protein
MPSPGLDSYNQNMVRNADGSVDIYFGPLLRRRRKRTGFPQPPEKPWFTMFRFYGPEKAVFDKRSMKAMEAVTR